MSHWDVKGLDPGESRKFPLVASMATQGIDPTSKSEQMPLMEQINSTLESMRPGQRNARATTCGAGDGAGVV
jgi:hypothetical protein